MKYQIRSLLDPPFESLISHFYWFKMCKNEIIWLITGHSFLAEPKTKILSQPDALLSLSDGGRQRSETFSWYKSRVKMSVSHDPYITVIWFACNIYTHITTCTPLKIICTYPFICIVDLEVVWIYNMQFVVLTLWKSITIINDAILSITLMFLSHRSYSV